MRGQRQVDAVSGFVPRILYEDNHLLVVEKPVNMPVQADSSGDADLLNALKAYLREAYHKPGEAYLGLVHRLDRPVGGVMVFAKTSKAAARLTDQFHGNRANKRYAAVVTGEAASEATLTDWLLKDEATFSSAVVPPETAGAKRAMLRYSRLARVDGRTLLDVELFTGRPHQIRVQLSHAGLPIVNDMRYNPAASKGAQIALWSYALTLFHPTLNERMTFTCLPADAAFQPFAAAVAMLPACSVCRGVYMDDDMLVVDKNAGVETEGDLTVQLQTLFGEAYPVHRLDANTLGLCVFARNERAAERLEQQFRTHALTKIYHAVVLGHPPAGDGLVHWLKKDADAAVVRVCAEGAVGAKRCELAYRTLAADGERTLLEINLLTGRTHQIRVQMAAVGCPVLGDDKYGDCAANKRFGVKTQQLLSKRLIINGQTFESQRELSL